jgi:hypothetical protein
MSRPYQFSEPDRITSPLYVAHSALLLTDGLTLPGIAKHKRPYHHPKPPHLRQTSTGTKLRNGSKLSRLPMEATIGVNMMKTTSME